MSSCNRRHVPIGYAHTSSADDSCDRDHDHHDGGSHNNGYHNEHPKKHASTSATNGILPSSNLAGLELVDNAAIALRTIPAGEELTVDDSLIGKCQFDIPEGHRFTTQKVAKGQNITSWGVPFGVALRNLDAGEYLCNGKVLATLRSRKRKGHLPTEPTFENAKFSSYKFDEASFTPTCRTVDTDLPVEFPSTAFWGIPRTGGRGTGTRNYVVIIGISSLVAGFVRALEKSYRGTTHNKGIDGVVAVAHTEVGSRSNDKEAKATNQDKVLRTLAGFAVHPNVGGVLLVDRGTEEIQISHLVDFMQQNDYPLDQVPHNCMTTCGAFEEDIQRARDVIGKLLESAANIERVERPISEIFLAQQCGGSDAFSGISANPLSGWVARSIVAQGGGALLAETDELMGAEKYVLEKIPDKQTAQKFLQFVDRFYAYAKQFGHSPEGNPSSGNVLRGLYNITLKSCGAAMKKFPDVRLSNVLEYGERFVADRRGYCFMDSPGNDLESIAGQVACGCNMILFTTGNGAITNFPFVPTVKVLTTTARYRLLSEDMDINAGVYLDGTAMSELGLSTTQYVVDAASGNRTKGELAGHHQVQIWREWRRLSPSDVKKVSKNYSQSAAELTGGLASAEAQLVSYDGDGPRKGNPIENVMGKVNNTAWEKDVLSRLELLSVGGTSDRCYVTERVGLILPTSLCSSHVSQMLADRLNQVNYPGISRVVALPHTEGCGHSAGDSEEMAVRTILGYALHPMIACAVLVEHGCEKTHNDRLSESLKMMGKDPSIFGYASIQLDGGIEGANRKILDHYEKKCPLAPLTRAVAAPSGLRIGIVSTVEIPSGVAQALGDVTQSITSRGGMVVVSGTATSSIQHILQGSTEKPNATLGYGQHNSTPGLHIMHSSSRHFVETLTGLGATGVEVILAYVDCSMEPHPFIPVIQIAVDGSAHDVDVILSSAEHGSSVRRDAWFRVILERVVDVASRRCKPKLFEAGCSNIQITRGSNGISL